MSVVDSDPEKRTTPAMRLFLGLALSPTNGLIIMLPRRLHCRDKYAVLEFVGPLILLRPKSLSSLLHIC